MFYWQDTRKGGQVVSCKSLLAQPLQKNRKGVGGQGLRQGTFSSPTATTHQLNSGNEVNRHRADARSAVNNCEESLMGQRCRPLPCSTTGTYLGCSQALWLPSLGFKLPHSYANRHCGKTMPQNPPNFSWGLGGKTESFCSLPPN